MQQSHTVLLDYKKPESPGAIGFWLSTGDGRETKYVRVFCGLALPQLDGQAAALIVLGEVFRSFAPVDLWGLAAATGSWGEVKNLLLQFCRDLKPSDIITENKETQRLVWSVTDSLVKVSPVSALTAVAPAHSLTELGRQNVDLLIAQDQLHLDHLLDVLNSERDSADRALRCAINYALQFQAFYGGKKKGQPEYKILGTDGL